MHNGRREPRSPRRAAQRHPRPPIVALRVAALRGVRGPRVPRVRLLRVAVAPRRRILAPLIRRAHPTPLGGDPLPIQVPRRAPLQGQIVHLLVHQEALLLLLNESALEM